MVSAFPRSAVPLVPTVPRGNESYLHLSSSANGFMPPRIFGFGKALRACSAKRKSSRVVIFRFTGEPGTTARIDPPIRASRRPRPGRRGYLALELRMGVGHSRRAYLIQCKAVEKLYLTKNLKITLDVIRTYPEMKRSGSLYIVSYIILEKEQT